MSGNHSQKNIQWNNLLNKIKSNDYSIGNSLKLSGMLLYESNFQKKIVFKTNKQIETILSSEEIQELTISQLSSDIKELTNDIETLSRIDNISRRARNDLGMVPAQAESLIIYINNFSEAAHD